MSPTSEFQKWFEAQYGPRPGGKPASEVLQDAANAEEAARVYREVADRALQYLAWEDAALKAWCAAMDTVPR